MYNPVHVYALGAQNGPVEMPHEHPAGRVVEVRHLSQALAHHDDLCILALFRHIWAGHVADRVGILKR